MSEVEVKTEGGVVPGVPAIPGVPGVTAAEARALFEELLADVGAADAHDLVRAALSVRRARMRHAPCPHCGSRDVVNSRGKHQVGAGAARVVRRYMECRACERSFEVDEPAPQAPTVPPVPPVPA